MPVLDSRRRRSVLILMVLTSITLLTLDLQNFGPLRGAQSLVRDLVSPATGGAGSVFSPVTSAWRSFSEFDELQKENDRLRSELGNLEGNAIRTRAANEVLHELYEQLDVTYIGGVESVVAEVVSRPGNFSSYSVEIGAGASDGIRVGMPAVTAAGLIGRVSAVQDDYSRIRLLHQRDYAVGIRVIGTGEVALARGSGVGEDMAVTEGLTEQSRVEVGDPVVTSGIEGSSYPPDIPVGVVSEVEFDSSQLKQAVKIRLVADLEHLRFVTVLLWVVDGDLQT